MAEIGFDSWYPYPGYEPATGADTDNERYTAWALNDMVRFTFEIPAGYVSGSDIALTFTEKTAGVSKAHLWSASVSLAGATAQVFTEEYTSPSTASQATARSLELSASGLVNTVAMKVGDRVSVILMRDDASSNEDSNSIYVYAPALVSTGGCLGAVGELVALVRQDLNDSQQKITTNSAIVQWFNLAMDDLTQALYFRRESTIDIVANQDSYDLLTLIPGYRRILGVRKTTASYPYAWLTACRSWPEFVALSLQSAYALNDVPAYWFLMGSTLYIWPVPTAAETDGLTVVNAYKPDDLTCWDDADLPVPAGSRDLFVFYALYRAHKRRWADGGTAEAQDYYGLYERQKSALLGAQRHIATSIVPYR
jgi:hypothetical protein